MKAKKAILSHVNAICMSVIFFLFIIPNNIVGKESIYESGTPIKQLTYQDDKVYTMVDHMPQYPGGDFELYNYVKASLEYPKAAMEEGIQGRVVVCFIVEKDGSITAPEVVRSIDKSLDDEALRIIKNMPKWSPGKNGDTPVRVKYTMPIAFRIQ